MQKQKGFTIIELIVVIAIIAILAAIVMVNVTQYIQKSKIATIKSNLSGIPVMATAYLEETGSFSGFCDELTNISNSISANGSGYTLTCYDEGNVIPAYKSAFNGKWAAYAYNQTANALFCIDSTGRKNANGITWLDAGCTAGESTNW
ncbi:MAG: prepilin-type N-terminal cleavage/methylation domain-containing protein [Candidatus Staskawiczbacteria bacterium]